MKFRKSESYEEDQPGTWRMIEGPEGDVFIIDLNGHYLSLKNHAIFPDGVVQPSVVCPVEGCGFHEFVLLEGY